ncbi:hypothetical protein CGZ92_12365 [Parenemella sanctibonifatiensis]|uniref:Histidine phosphatase family protein n=1 Tax=Parenemella sanctibonifatiensis TaxID=2016505 RepID=A0A255E919_9ACTN|nr:hypothetical protein CGZ92_12365 [Parenemella sanctibonifatiensis]
MPLGGNATGASRVVGSRSSPWRYAVKRQRNLWLLRHAEAAQLGARDLDRPLTERGQRQAAQLGETLAASNVLVDLVLCSPARRTRETLAGLTLAPEPEVRIVDGIYEAGVDTLHELVREIDETATTVLMVGHAPGIPGLLHALADADSTTRLAPVAHHYPPATAVRLVSPLRWQQWDQAYLSQMQLPQA